MYDTTLDAITFDLQVRAGSGYVESGQRMLNADFKLEFFLDDDVTINMFPYPLVPSSERVPKGIANSATQTEQILFNVDNPIPELYPHPASNVSIGRRVILPPAVGHNFGLDWETVASISYPVTSEKKPSSHSYIRIRPFDRIFNGWLGSSWSSPERPVESPFDDMACTGYYILPDSLQICDGDTPIVITGSGTTVCDGEIITLSFLQSLISSSTCTTVEFYSDADAQVQFTPINTNYNVASSHTIYVIARNIATGCAINLEDALELTITVNPGPATITAMSEEDLFLYENEDLYLFVEAEGNPQYQWYYESNTIPGAVESHYRVFSNASKAGVYSVEVSNECGTAYYFFNVQTNLLVNDVTIDPEFKVYPNPATSGSTITISLKSWNDEQPDAVAYIYDITGRIVKSLKITNYTTEIVVDFVASTYMVKVVTKRGKEFVEKIIIQ
jgi:hypothetical protein